MPTYKDLGNILGGPMNSSKHPTLEKTFDQVVSQSNKDSTHSCHSH